MSINMAELEGDRLYREATTLMNQMNDYAFVSDTIRRLLFSAARHGSIAAIRLLAVLQYANPIDVRLDYMEVYVHINLHECSFYITLDVFDQLIGNVNWEHMYRLGRMLHYIGQPRWRYVEPPNSTETKNLAKLQKCESYYLCSREQAKLSVFTWMFSAKQLGLYRDVALLIGRIVWDGRMTDFGPQSIHQTKKRK